MTRWSMNWAANRPKGTFVYGGNLANDVASWVASLVASSFIRIFLSLIFMVGTVIVIYYKQISEGYEDRDASSSPPTGGARWTRVKRTIITVKCGLSSSSLLIFAFIHLAFAYHMIRLILKVLGVINSGQVLIVTLNVRAVFLITYLIVFWITSRAIVKIANLGKKNSELN